MFGTSVLGTGPVRREGVRGARRLGSCLLVAGLLSALGGSTAAFAAASPPATPLTAAPLTSVSPAATSSAAVSSAASSPAAASSGAASPAISPPADYSGAAYQILAPGDFGGLPPDENSFDQGNLYNDLTPLMGNVTPADLEKYFLSEKFGVTGPVVRTEEPEPGLVIQRDKNDIPHVYGQTRDEVMFGSGYIAAEDRGLLLALGLGPAYAAALEIPGINPFELLLTGRSFTPSAQAVNFVAEQKNSLIEKGPEGEQVLKDLEDWAEGVNAYEGTLGAERILPPLNATSAMAGFALIGSIFGNGGGNEVNNSNFLAKLEAKLGANGGLKVFRDLKEVNDPEAPTTTSIPFPYDGVPTGPTPGAAVIDPSSESSSAASAMAATKASKRKASNFLLAGPEHSADRHPLAVMGPQLGYFYPEIVMQADLHGGGIDADGAIAPISPYVFIGRGRDFAWSLTSAGSENTQQFLEKLCNPDNSPPTRESTSYIHNGKCVPMATVDAGTLGASETEPERELTFMETDHGPVTGTVTVHGAPYAIARDRSTRGREPAGELAFSDFDSDRVHNPQQFFNAANELETTFNIPYIDNRHIAYFSAGRLPILAPGTDPSLPTLGTGQYEWRGFLSENQHPHDVAPRSDIFLNWNNKPAPGWGASSDNYSYGPVHRVQLFTGFKQHMTEADLASIMNKAATQDLPAVEDWPLIKRVLDGGRAPSPLAQQAASIVSTWVAHGASRFGVVQPEEPGAAILDAAWKGIGEAVLGPVLGTELTSEFASMVSPDNAPSSSGSSYDEGWYGYVYKDLKTELGYPVAGPFSRRYCGSGSLSACRTSLWAAVQNAANALKEAQGPEPSKWRAAPVRITFPPTFDPLPPTFTEPFTMDWTNRSTFQQVIEFTGHAPE
jgi:acyl-homoserine lactone acylase PvdQ